MLVGEISSPQKNDFKIKSSSAASLGAYLMRSTKGILFMQVCFYTHNSTVFCLIMNLMDEGQEDMRPDALAASISDVATNKCVIDNMWLVVAMRCHFRVISTELA